MGAAQADNNTLSHPATPQRYCRKEPSMTIRALVFDAYGTLYDVESMRGLATELCGDKGELITQVWRLKQLEYSWLRGLMQTYEDFSVVTGDSLDFALERVGVRSTATIRDSLMAKYLK